MVELVLRKAFGSSYVGTTERVCRSYPFTPVPKHYAKKTWSGIQAKLYYWVRDGRPILHASPFISCSEWISCWVVAECECGGRERLKCACASQLIHVQFMRT